MAIQVPYRSYKTQRIANRYPMWNKIRSDSSSTGQSLLNELVGIWSEDLTNFINQSAQNKFIGTADISEVDVAKTLQLPVERDLPSPSTTNNFLRNSGFEICTVPKYGPDHWRTGISGSYWSIDDSVSRFGNRSLRLDPTSSSSSSIQQTVDIRVMKGETWEFSFWYRIDSTAQAKLVPPLCPGPNVFGLRAEGRIASGGTENACKEMDRTTNGEWKKLSLVHTFQNDCTDIVFKIGVDTDISFPFSQTIYFDSMQLRKSSVSARWEPHILDSPPWISNTLASPVCISLNQSAWYTEDLNDWWFGVPTRFVSITSKPKSSTSLDSAGIGFKYDFWNKKWTVTWKISSNKIQKVGVEVPGDIFQTYTLHYVDDKGVENPDVVDSMEAIAFINNRLYLIGNQTSLNGTQFKYLKIIDPRTDFPEPTTLRVLNTISLPIPVSETLIRAEFKYLDNHHIFASTSTKEYRIRLAYDYFIVDSRLKKVFFKEPYENILVTIPSDIEQ